MVDPAGVLSGQGMILQDGDAAPVICLGGVSDSNPPQCGGPELIGLDWTDVPDAETVQGVTFGEARVVGRYDGTAFTLTQPPSAPMIPVEPDGGTGADPFAPLCDDPFRGGDESILEDPDASYPAQEALGLALEGYAQYAGSWVSTDLTDAELDAETAYVPTYHVLVTGDAEQARKEFREVWPGGLCVEQRDVATEQDVRAAQDAVMGADIPGIESSGGLKGRLEVRVLLADQSTVDQIHDAVAPWLSPGEVDIRSSLLPAAPEAP